MLPTLIRQLGISLIESTLKLGAAEEVASPELLNEAAAVEDALLSEHKKQLEQSVPQPNLAEREARVVSTAK